MSFLSARTGGCGPIQYGGRRRKITLSGSVLRLAGPFNSIIMAASGLPVIGSRIRSYIAPITYTGRKSGRTITLPVSYLPANSMETSSPEGYFPRLKIHASERGVFDDSLNKGSRLRSTALRKYND